MSNRNFQNFGIAKQGGGGLTHVKIFSISICIYFPQKLSFIPFFLEFETCNKGWWVGTGTKQIYFPWLR